MMVAPVLTCVTRTCERCGETGYKHYNTGSGVVEPTCPICGYQARQAMSDFFNEERGPASWEV